MKIEQQKPRRFITNMRAVAAGYASLIVTIFVYRLFCPG